MQALAADHCAALLEDDAVQDHLEDNGVDVLITDLEYPCGLILAHKAKVISTETQ